MNAQWRLAVSVGGFWLCSGRLNKKKSPQKFSWHVGAGFLSLTSHVILGTFDSWVVSTTKVALP